MSDIRKLKRYFLKTLVIPDFVSFHHRNLDKYGDGKLVSRSQAKRLLVRIEKFKTVVFDFDDVEIIGQDFADKIFRVFKKQHLDME